MILEVTVTSVKKRTMLWCGMVRVGITYGKFFEKGEDKISTETDYTSENTKRLTDDELKEMLLKLDYIQLELAGGNQKVAEGF